MAQDFHRIASSGSLKGRDMVNQQKRQLDIVPIPCVIFMDLLTGQVNFVS
jgi:hypothetical protein